jgi:hypothetical protein
MRDSMRDAAWLALLLCAACSREPQAKDLGAGHSGAGANGPAPQAASAAGTDSNAIERRRTSALGARLIAACA